MNIIIIDSLKGGEKLKLLKITDNALQQYRENVKDNQYTTLEQAVRKMTRNVQLVKEYAPDRVKCTWKGIIYSYGNLDIKVRFNTVIEIVNHKELKMPRNDFQ